MTEAVARSTIALPFHNGLTEAEVAVVVAELAGAAARRATQAVIG